MSITHVGNGEDAQSTFDTDIIVVGAGPAGATEAYYLSKTGLNGSRPKLFSPRQSMRKLR
jgi:ribulose 1,5-bisphosphate synthetase/thiazole synthase